MTARDFCFWLQGDLELNGVQEFSKTKVEMIAKHLSLVFTHEIDPSMGDLEHQNALNTIHSPNSSMDEIASFNNDPVNIKAGIKMRC